MITRRKRESLCKPNTSIDMTPLMDLTFMLLIVFVITVPVMEYATDVTPPELNSDRRLEDDSNPLVIALSVDGKISVDSTQVALFQLKDHLVKIRQARGGDIDVMIRADGQQPYQEVVNIMRTAKHAGFTSISLMTQAEKQE